MTDRPDGDTTRATTAKAGKGRQKAQPVVDLPAEAVTEITPVEVQAESVAPVVPEPDTALSEPRPEPLPMPPRVEEPSLPPPPVPEPAPVAEQRPSRLMPVLAGLVAGLVGGVAASQLLPAVRGAQPATDPALVGRVAQLEQQARAVRPGEPIPPAVTQKLQQLDGLLAELPKREAALKAEIAALRQALESRPAPVAAQPAGPSPAIEALSARIGTVEQGVRALPQGVSQLSARVDALQPRLETVTRDIQSLSSRIGGLGARDALSGANARLAAVTLADEAFARSKPLAPALDLLKGLLPDTAPLATLQAFAEKGPDTPVALAAALKAAIPKSATAEEGKPASWTERMRQSAMAFVDVRKTGDVTGADDPSALRRAEQAVLRGDLAAALAATARLSPAVAPAFAEWRAGIERQIKARETLVQLRQDAMAFLAQTAQAAK
ncbi:MAG: COG4223 family protein [Rhabdaerophilum sp.]